MGLDISAIDKLLPEAIRIFWESRTKAVKKQKLRGASDQGNRAGVTAGKNMDGFISMIKQLIVDNGVTDAEIFTNGRIQLSLPGYYRPTKNWDLLIVGKRKLIAAIEFKSQVGPSFGNNFNNRVEEALGNAIDIKTAYREGAFGESQEPFIGYFFVLEDCDKSTSTVSFSSPHFPVMKDFIDTSYARRYEILCRKLVHENLYSSATLLMTNRNDIDNGKYTCLSELTSVKRFAISLAGKAASFSID